MRLKDGLRLAETSALESKESETVALRLDLCGVHTPPLPPVRVRHAAFDAIFEDSEKFVMHGSVMMPNDQELSHGHGNCP